MRDWNKNIVSEPPGDSWGGPWTEKKLQAFEDYVKAYLTIMHKNPYRGTIYFDGFAGSGDKGRAENPLYTQMELSGIEEYVYQGAAERISQLEEQFRFDFYYFIENNETAINKLKEKIEKLNSGKKGKQEYRIGDCNGELKKLAKALHQAKKPGSSSLKYAALIFLDPFGMQIEWSSIEKLRGTKSDVWILLPTAVIVNRLLDRKGKLKTIHKLESFFGIPEEKIREYFYVPTGQVSMFDPESGHYSKVASPIEKIAELYIDKMKTIWTHVTKKPLKLVSARGTPLFHLVFASNNKAALDIANHIIKNN